MSSASTGCPAGEPGERAEGGEEESTGGDPGEGGPEGRQGPDENPRGEDGCLHLWHHGDSVANAHQP